MANRQKRRIKPASEEEESLELTSNEVTVFLSEEYGYRTWLWYTGMTAEALEKWWSRMPTVAPYFFTPEGLPGDLVQVYPEIEDGEISCWIVESPSRECFAKLYNVDNFWHGHLHDECDSFIANRDNKILHAGYVAQEEYYDEEYMRTEKVQEAWNKARDTFVRDKLEKDIKLCIDHD